MRVKNTAIEWETGLAQQFDDLPQQHEAATLGMWVFLATEILMFGGLFTAFTAYRATYPHAFEVGSEHLYRWIGVGNTAVLLLSSLFVALAVHAIKHGDNRACTRDLVVAAALGVVFLGLKSIEYTLDIREGLLPWYHFHPEGANDAATKLFLVFYWFMTGLHAVHVTIGIVLLLFFAALCRRGEYDTEWHNPIEMVGLYWHFVDIVWIFLLPTLYLIKPG
ncbi:MAG TPA: cytochrome c oxidase subunit 3 family protein [Phycisphaerae bacterium]|nr:cytochrome c oxidase subunit 3 family protein [Phycisphaerales bacterium]HRX84649.1 cytochrome c oxidase subunit 3 family protein [Phycisphaerae bacterium]